MRRSCNKITHVNNLHVGVNNVNISQRHNNTFRRLPLHGFTLIELLVVISIIALLVSILMPALGKAKQQAKNAVCQAHLRGLGLGLILYLSENEERFYMPTIKKDQELKVLNKD